MIGSGSVHQQVNGRRLMFDDDVWEPEIGDELK
jgi:hypothetical protein